MYTIAGRNKMLMALGVTHAAAYQGDPSNGGTELDRQAITWGAAANGEREQSANPEFAIGAGETVNHIGYYDAGTGGTLLMVAPVTPETFANAGTYTLTSSKHHLNLEDS